jgi:hypothetical protein
LYEQSVCGLIPVKTLNGNKYSACALGKSCASNSVWMLHLGFAVEQRLGLGKEVRHQFIVVVFVTIQLYKTNKVGRN